MTNWTPGPAQRMVLTICGTILFVHAYYNWIEDESISLPILGGALLYTAALSSSSQVERIAASTWGLVTKRWRQIAIALAVGAIILAIFSYRQSVAEQEARAKEHSEFEAAMKVREAEMNVQRARIESAYSGCLKAASSQRRVADARESEPETQSSELPDPYAYAAEMSCKYVRDRALEGME